MGLQAASIYDIVGQKDIDRGFTILTMAFGLGSFVALPIAGQNGQDQTGPERRKIPCNKLEQTEPRSSSCMFCAASRWCFCFCV